MTDKKQKRAYLPDFMISVTDLADTKVFSVMTDYATGRSVIFDKVCSFKGDAIIIAETVLRLEELFGYLIEDSSFRAVNSKNEINRLPSNTYFVIWGDFVQHGFHAKFRKLPEWDTDVKPIVFPKE